METPVDSCTLQFDGAALLEFDDTLIPTGKVLPDHRFAEGTSLDGIFLDNCFALDPLTPQAGCVFSSKQLQLTISPAASYPYLQVYTPEHRKSIAIENLSAPPDAFNNGIGLLLAEKNKPAIFSTTYRVETI
jgi:aldose 1-epimerase